MTTDHETPRTDAARNGDWVHYTIAMMLERELNELWSRFDKQMEAEAEVERLRKQLQRAKAKIKELTPCGCDNYLQITCKKHTNL